MNNKPDELLREVNIDFIDLTEYSMLPYKKFINAMVWETGLPRSYFNKINYDLDEIIIDVTLSEGDSDNITLYNSDRFTNGELLYNFVLSLDGEFNDLTFQGFTLSETGDKYFPDWIPRHDEIDEDQFSEYSDLDYALNYGRYES
jgi:hypothetical protein